ncbi:hypothetical protein RRG08_012509 [Elysia crispata]|uniref:Uncharacterized protein n=1 Tax=Elysia crispata TaxID=231223 RepID=A0AAE1E3B3_9GAST|nr:hypothetical protein RRG08_012509 [Elysia crispata]
MKGERSKGERLVEEEKSKLDARPAATDGHPELAAHYADREECPGMAVILHQVNSHIVHFTHIQDTLKLDKSKKKSQYSTLL